MARGSARRALASGVLLALSIAAGGAMAAPDGAAIVFHGIGTAPACASCHGAQGQGNPAIGAPPLAGDGSAYLREQLANFASGQRINPIMQPIAHALSPGQRDAAAQVFAGMPALAPHRVAPEGNPLGARLAERGRWSEHLPACTQCHGPDGVGVGTAFPHLAGLAAPYIASQLAAFRDGKRPPGPLGLMARVAHKLSPADVAAVSAYFAAAGGAGAPGKMP
jgi:cytochrome c553